MGFLDSLFGGGDSTSTMMPDVGTQAWSQQYRDMAQRYAGSNLGLPSSFNAADISRYMDPYMQSVIQGMNPTFNQMRANALQQANDEAVAGHAYGGSRSGILAAQMMGGVNQQQAQFNSQLLSQGYQGALAQLNQDRNFGLSRDQSIFNILSGGFQGGGYTSTMHQPTNILGGLIGMGTTGLGIAKMFNPATAGVGAAAHGFNLGAALGDQQPQVTGNSVSWGYNPILGQPSNY